jgi:hypothetical protein
VDKGFRPGVPDLDRVRACARKAVTAYAHNARMQSPWAARLYADARTRGKRNPHATRIVARAWIRVIWACWHSGVPYDPATHHAQQRLTT